MTVDHARWRNAFHLTPPTGWLNDPNGLCQYRGTYHVFHQYSPDWPEPDAPRGWGHFTSRDLVRWEHHGMVVAPDTPDEASGAYSGCAVEGDDGRLRLYYTGNVKEPGDFDYVRAGRRATQIMIECEPDDSVPGGLRLGEKNVLLRNADYPAGLTCHVRDPKVWRDGRTWWMLLGARDATDRALALVLRSDDGVSWENAGSWHADGPLGYMWECPDRVALGGREWLSICPQGVEGHPWSHGLRDASGYVPLAPGARVADGGTLAAGDFRPWDAGFDFYAPQTFVDEGGRTLLVGWMGLPEAPWESAPDGLSWCHCLTVPREVTAAPDGCLLQRPAAELEALRGERREVAAEGALRLGGRCADVELAGADDGVEVLLDETLRVTLAGGRLRLEFCGPDAAAVGAGRGAREASVPDDARDLRVLVDGSAVEVFAAGGRAAMATRWFPRADALSVRVRGAGVSGGLWPMADGAATGPAGPAR